MRKSIAVFALSLVLGTFGCSADSIDGPKPTCQTDPSLCPPPPPTDTADTITVVVGTVGTTLPTTVNATWIGGSTTATFHAFGSDEKALVEIPQGFTGNVTLDIVGNAETSSSQRIVTYAEYHGRNPTFTLHARNFEGEEMSLDDMLRSATSTDVLSYVLMWKQTLVGTGATIYTLATWSHIVTTAIDHGASVPYLPSDSAKIWEGLDALNTALGTIHYTPSSSTSADFKVTILEGGSNILTGAVGATGNSKEFVSGTMLIGSLSNLRDPAVADLKKTQLMHEGTHGLGFGHTCSFKSIMVPSVDPNTPCGALKADFPTHQDIAIVHYIEAFAAKQRTMNAPYGLVEALNGQRVLEKGMPSATSTSPSYFTLPANN